MMGGGGGGGGAYVPPHQRRDARLDMERQAAAKRREMQEFAQSIERDLEADGWRRGEQGWNYFFPGDRYPHLHFGYSSGGFFLSLSFADATHTQIIRDDWLQNYQRARREMGSMSDGDAMIRRMDDVCNTVKPGGKYN